jgi:hypothetical protein
MARLRLLFALLAITAGAGLGALALSGYYEPHPLRAQTARSETAPTEEKASPMARPFRQRFVAAVTSDQARPGPPAKPKPHQKKAAPAKPKPPPTAEKRPRRAEAPWPWSLFTN